MYVLLTIFLLAPCLVTSQLQPAREPEPFSTMTERICFRYGYCYEMWMFREPQTKQQASVFCRDRGETLATIPTEEVEKRLVNQLTGSYDDDSWVGLSIAPTSSRNWNWLSKDGWLENRITFESKDDPTSACALINRNNLLGSPCSYSLSYICELDEEPDSTDCSFFKQEVDSKWICAHKTNVSWFSAATRCHQLGGNLLIIETESMYNKTIEMLQRVNRHLWTAGTRVMFSWDEVDAPFIHPSSLIWSPQVQRNPNLQEAWRRGSFCVTLSNSRQGLINKECDFTAGYAICSKVNPNPHEGLEGGARPGTIIQPSAAVQSTTTTSSTTGSAGSSGAGINTTTTPSTTITTSPSTTITTSPSTTITPTTSTTITTPAAATTVTATTTTTTRATTTNFTMSPRLLTHKAAINTSSPSRTSINVGNTSPSKPVIPTTKGTSIKPVVNVTAEPITQKADMSDGKAAVATLNVVVEYSGKDSRSQLPSSETPEYSGINRKQYRAVLICAYVLAALVIVGIILIVVMLVRRQQRKRRPKFYDPIAERRSYKTLGNGTLGRQRSSEPSEEWEKVITENGDLPAQMRHKKNDADDLDIVHNVDEPLTVPRESHVVTLQRAKSRDSQNSLASSDVATFTLDRRSNASSVSIQVPPVPPKTKPILKPESANSPDKPFPPPPPEALKPLQPPPPPPKPSKCPPRRQRRRAPDPIYAQIDKGQASSTLPRPSAPSPKPAGYATLRRQLNVDTAALPDNCDSGVEMGVYSPPPPNSDNASTGSKAQQLASTEYLDSIVDHMTNY